MARVYAPDNQDMPKITYVSELSHLPEGEQYVALMDESFTSGERGDYTTTKYVRLIHLGTRENALEWLREQEESRLRSTYHKNYRIVVMKTMPIQRTISLASE